MATAVEDGEPVLRFRNYHPRDGSLRGYEVEEPSIEELERVIDEEAQKTIGTFRTENVLAKLQPEHANWDVKRDVERRMKILGQRTDEAVAQLVRQKKKADGGFRG